MINRYPGRIGINKTNYLDRKKIIAVIDTTFAVVKRKPEKNQACTGFEPKYACLSTGQRFVGWIALFSIRTTGMEVVEDEAMPR